MIRQDWGVLELGVVQEDRPLRQQGEGEEEGERKMEDRLLLLLVSEWTWSGIDDSAKGASAAQSISCETTAGKTIAMTASVSG